MKKFCFCLIQEWPPLAWAAQCSTDNMIINVYHGSRIETGDAWFCEAVWDRDYSSGDFDLTDMVFGSGCRLRDEKVVFVSSGTTIDRLLSFCYDGGLWVSNSLACLLTVTDAKLDLSDTSYMQQLGSVVKGLTKYEKYIASSVGDLRLTYFNNLQWDGKELIEVDKPNKMNDFSSFTKYHDFLLSSLQRISTNMSAKERKFPYKLLGTLSSGYDSTTNTVLAHKAGLNEVLSFTSARGGEADDGKKVADLLCIQLTLIPRNRWQGNRLIEALFLAADAKGEDVYFSAAGEFLSGSVLLTGFHGDKVWSKENQKLDDSIVRGDRSGLSLTEYRLMAGFINLSVPFMGVRQIKEINRISNSEEMKPWDIPGDYSRPVCRRIAEEAGIPRDYFGIKKKATSVLIGSTEDSVSPFVRQALMAWLRNHKSLWSSKGKASPLNMIKLLNYCHLPLRFINMAIRIISHVTPNPVNSYLLSLSRRMKNLNRDLYLLKFAFPWAVEQVKEKYFAYHRYADNNKKKQSQSESRSITTVIDTL